MTESYELPVLFTDDECKAYAAWGMKKEKVLVMDTFLDYKETLYDNIEDFADKTGIDIAACRSAKYSGGLLKKRYYID